MSEIMLVLWIMLLCFPLYFIRIIKGPSVWDRILGLSLVSTKVVIVIILWASLNDTAYILDFAIAYALLGFIGIAFIAHFLLDRIKGGNKWK